MRRGDDTGPRTERTVSGVFHVKHSTGLMYFATQGKKAVPKQKQETSLPKSTRCPLLFTPLWKVIEKQLSEITFLWIKMGISTVNCEQLLYPSTGQIAALKILSPKWLF